MNEEEMGAGIILVLVVMVIFFVTGVLIYFSPYHSCMRAHANSASYSIRCAGGQ